MSGDTHLDPIDRKLHVAIIMDGNGRWANGRGWPRIAGHRAGMEAVDKVVEGAPDVGIGTLTLYAFSADNWTRPRPEVVALMELLSEYLKREIARCVREGVRVSFIGRRDRIPKNILRAMEHGEEQTSGCETLHLRLAVDYSARDSILRAAKHLLASNGDLTRERFLEILGEVEASHAVAPEVDLMIRTGGEKRLSDFLLWESAYAELYFTEVMWPDFDVRKLDSAIREFRGRQRRFGGLPGRVAS